MNNTTIMKYLTKIYWSDDDEAYVAEVPALPGCAAHGDSYEEAARNVHEAMNAWLECARHHGDPIPEPDLVAEEIARFSGILNISKLARLAGMNKHTLASKLRRHSRFTNEEAGGIRKAIGSI